MLRRGDLSRVTHVNVTLYSRWSRIPPESKPYLSPCSLPRSFSSLVTPPTPTLSLLLASGAQKLAHRRGPLRGKTAASVAVTHTEATMVQVVARSGDYVCVGSRFHRYPPPEYEGASASAAKTPTISQHLLGHFSYHHITHGLAGLRKGRAPIEGFFTPRQPVKSITVSTSNNIQETNSGLGLG